MALTPGTRLGSYEITGAIGAGGMGEVYRARDTRLGRDVALKVLPDLFAHDPDRIARFVREAQVLASLNHPNIAHATGMGVILGTAAYMSPEQAKGKAADRRADVWAFGVVLFEMLTGRQAFTGERPPRSWRR